jgi:hypothetical protein
MKQIITLIVYDLRIQLRERGSIALMLVALALAGFGLFEGASFDRHTRRAIAAAQAQELHARAAANGLAQRYFSDPARLNSRTCNGSGRPSTFAATRSASTWVLPTSRPLPALRWPLARRTSGRPTCAFAPNRCSQPSRRWRLNTPPGWLRGASTWRSSSCICGR